MQRLGPMGLVRDIDSFPLLPNVLLAVMFIPLGLVVIWNRKRIFEFVVRYQRAVSRRSAEVVSRLSRPFWIGVVGAVASGMGVVLLVVVISHLVGLG